MDKSKLNIGPIIRISPHEVHIDDLEFFHKFYSTKKLKKYPWFYKMAGTRDVSFAIEENDSHRQRQGVYKNLFSMRSIQAFENKLMEKGGTLSQLFQRNIQTIEPINLTQAYDLRNYQILHWACRKPSVKKFLPCR